VFQEKREDDSQDGYLLFVGRLRIRKGVEVLLHAMQRLGERDPNHRLLIVGSGEHRDRLEKVVAKLNLGARVEFLGACEPERIPRLMAGARALVVPSIYEGMPLVVLEAMAAGVPVVASRVSGIPEVVQDGVSGWLVPPEDVETLAAVLQEIEEDPEEARRRGLQGRMWVETSSTPAEAAQRWSELVMTPGPAKEK
jgi:glycosyltransferase involved in cell wall biosynthesis